jgi:hypothetical protein
LYTANAGSLDGPPGFSNRVELRVPLLEVHLEGRAGRLNGMHFGEKTSRRFTAKHQRGNALAAAALTRVTAVPWVLDVEPVKIQRFLPGGSRRAGRGI